MYTLYLQAGNRRGEVLTMFTSAQGHYSVDKSAMVMGIGTNQVIKVPCDEYGRIIPSELGQYFMYRNDQRIDVY